MGRMPTLYPVQEAVDQVVTATTPGRIPRTLEKIASGKPVKIVCWGDSVTVGGDASSPEYRYSAVFARRLAAKYPGKPIEVETIAVGGSHSRQWLWPEKFPGREGCDWQRIVEAKPDLVTLEFVNDAGLSGETFEQVYDEILARVKALGAELILISPHFTKPEMIGLQNTPGTRETPLRARAARLCEKAQSGPGRRLRSLGASVERRVALCNPIAQRDQSPG